MTEVFDYNKMPDRRLSVRTMISLHAQHISLGETIQIVKRQMAEKLVAKILDDKSFFWSNSDQAGSHSFLEYGADCIVLTTDEVAAMKRESFKDGLRHAQGFMLIPKV